MNPRVHHTAMKMGVTACLPPLASMNEYYAGSRPWRRFGAASTPRREAMRHPNAAAGHSPRPFSFTT